MKRFACIALCLLLISIIVPQISPAETVVNTDELITTAVSETDANYFLDRLNVEVLDDETFQYAITCFAVRDDGVFALGFDSLDTHTVFVYDQEGSFQYGLRFQLPGSFGLFFSDKNLSIYSPRSGYTAEYDGVSRFVDVHKVTDAFGNNEIIRSVMNGAEIKNDAGTYTLERNIGIVARSYSRVVVNEGNNEKVLYEISGAHTVAVILNILLVAGFVAALWFVVTYNIRKNKEQQR